MLKTIALSPLMAVGVAVLQVSLVAHGAEGTSTNSPSLTIERLFAGNEFSVKQWGESVWAKSGGGFYKFEKAENPRDGNDLVLFRGASTNQEIILPAHAFRTPGDSSPLAVERFEFSDDESRLLLFTNSKRVWRQNTRGDYWVMDVTSRELRKLGGDAPAASLLFAQLSPDGTKAAYVRANDLYVENVLDGAITRLTRDGSKEIINGTSDWVYEEELYLRQAYRWSPDSQRIAYWQIDSSGVPQFTLLNNTEGLYPRSIPIPYPKTGQQNSAARVGVVPAAGGDTRWLELPGDPRNHYISQLSWGSNSAEVVVQQLNRKQDVNQVYLAAASTGSARPLLAERDEAWVEAENDTPWIEDGRSFLWLSERSGWRRLYKVSRADGTITPLTQGEFDVIRIGAADAENKLVYFYASPENPTQQYLYRVGFDGKNMERVTPVEQSGSHAYNISPNGKFAIHTWSTFTNPPVTDLIELPSHKSLRKLEENKKLLEKLTALKRPASEFLRIDIGGGVELDAWAIKPPDFDPERKYPLLVYVYGEPHGQTVRDAWGSPGHLWHWMLAQRGCVVVSIDNRGTLSPRGRSFRKIIYRQVGLLASSDQAAAVRALLKKWPCLDPDRVGVWGWSGGGSMTLNAILRFPDLYKTAIAVASVPNQRLYDTIYQERYMGLPSENPEGYRKGSPLNYAGQLKGNLLLVHGTGDDNVHYQGMEALINELVAYNKQFSMMAYPNRTHGITEGHNTRRHLFTLMTDYLEAHLLAPPAAKTKSSAEGSNPKEGEHADHEHNEPETPPEQ